MQNSIIISTSWYKTQHLLDDISKTEVSFTIGNSMGIIEPLNKDRLYDFLLDGK